MKFIQAILLIGLAEVFLPSPAEANLAPTPFVNLPYSVLLLLPVMMGLTEWGGGYKIINSNRKPLSKGRRFVTGIAKPLSVVFVVYLSAMAGGRFFFFLLWGFTVFALVRGVRLMIWARAAKKIPLPDWAEKIKPRRLFSAGVLVIVSTLTLTLGLEAFQQYSYATRPRRRAYDSQTKSDLNDLYLACRAYWADIEETNNCNLAIAVRPEYGLIPSSEVVIEASGNRTSFSATAKHKNSRTGKTFSINEKGEITESRK